MTPQKQLSRILVGFDGFIDRIIHPVDTRQSKAEWTRIETMKDFSQRICAASNKSTNIEIVHQAESFGGNAPLFAKAAAHLEMNIDLLATVASSENRRYIDPLFQPIADLSNVEITPFHAPGRTDAYEFHDGKLLLGDMNGLERIVLNDLFATVPELDLLLKVQKAQAIATLNWTMMPLVQLFWKWLIHMATRRPSIAFPKKTLFVDFADQKKRPIGELKEAFSLLKECTQIGFDIVISLNTSEAMQSIKALQERETSDSASIEEMVQSIHLLFPEAKAIVGHSHKVVCASWKEENNSIFNYSISVPYIENPYASTGAGDSFNAGFLSGLIQKNSYEKALKWGLATSGIWIRTRTSATKEKIEQFLQNHLI